MLYSAVFVIDNSATQGSDATSVVPLSACPTIPLPHHSLFPPPYPPSSAAHFAQSWGNVSPLAATLMDPLAKCCKQKTYSRAKSFSCNTYKKRGGRGLQFSSETVFPSWHLLSPFAGSGPLSIATEGVLPPRGIFGLIRRACPLFPIPYPLAVASFPPATLFHPWLANDSANTSSPISTGAKRLRAPSGFPRIPPSRFRATISIAGSRLVPDTVK